MTFHIGTPHTHNAGYFINDKDLRTRQEDDVRTCPHCDRIIKMREWRNAAIQGFCIKCMAPTCDTVSCQLDCTPMLQRIDQAFDAVTKYHKYLEMVRPPPSVGQASIITDV